MRDNTKKSCKRRGQVTVKTAAFSFIFFVVMIAILSGVFFFTQGSGSELVDSFVGDGNLLTGAAIGVGDIGIGANCGGTTACSCGDNVIESYNFSADITDCASGGLTVGADDIEINCMGYQLTRNELGSGTGISISGRKNVNITNCTIVNFDDGVYFESGANFGKVTNSTLNTSGGSDDAIRMDNSIGFNITQNNIHTKGSSAYGIRFHTSNGTATHNTINTTGNGGMGIYLVTSTGSVVDQNNITVDGGDGVYAQTSEYINITNNNISQSDSSDGDIVLSSSDYIRIINNSGTDEIEIPSLSDNNTIISNRIRGLLTLGGDNNTVFSNVLYNGTAVSSSRIALSGDFNNVSYNNISSWAATVDAVSISGINNTFYHNIIISNGSSADGVTISANDNYIASNNITVYGASAVILSGTTNRTILLNNNLSSNQSKSIDDATSSSQVINYLVYNSSLGEIRWLHPPFLKQMDLVGDIGHYVNLFIGNNTIAFNASNFTGLVDINTTAQVRLFNFSYRPVEVFTISNYSQNNSEILNDGYACPDCDVTFINGSEIRFNITHFSSFSVAADTTAPNVDTIQIQDQTLIQNQSIILNASITDNDNVTHVFFEIEPFGNITVYNISNNWSIVCNATETCATADINELNWTGIWANDTSNNMNYTNPDLQFNVSENTAPSIGTVTINDTILLQNDSVNITVSITDDFSIDTVFFNFIGKENITASNNTQTDFYVVCDNATASLCATDNVSFTNLTLIWVNDTNGANATLNPGLNFSVVTPETNLPTISDNLAINTTVTGKNGTVKINITVTDDTGVDTVLFQINDFGNVTAQTTGSEYFIICNATNHCNTTRATIYNVSAVWATDGSANTNVTYPGLSYNVSAAWCGETLHDNVTLNTSFYGCGEGITFFAKTFDCDGNTIGGNGSDTGLTIDSGVNETIQNCVFENFTDGIQLSDDYINITNNTIRNMSNAAFVLVTADNASIMYNNLSSTGRIMSLTGSSGVNLTFAFNNILTSNSTISLSSVGQATKMNDNWWDNISCTNITQRISGKVNFTSYLDAPSPDGTSTNCPTQYCAMRVWEDIDFTGNIENCGTTPAVVVRGPNVTVDCKGFSVSGSSRNSDGFDLTNSHLNRTIQNCIVENFADGIEWSRGNHTTLVNNTFRNNTNGIYIRGGSGWIPPHHFTAVSTNLSNNTVGINISKLDGTSNADTVPLNATFYHTIFEGNNISFTAYDNEDDNFTSINSSINRSKLEIDASSTLYVDSYVEVNVTDGSTGAVLDGVTVEALNSLQDLEDSNITDSTGLARLQVTGFYTTDATNFLITPPTTIVVSKGNYTRNVTNISILETATVRLNISLTEITCDTNVTSDVVLGNNFSCGHGLRVTRDNVTIDGGGNRIIGNGSSLGIWLDNVSNVTVANVSLINHSIGLNLLNVNSSKFYNLELINNTKYGALFNQSHNNTIYDTNITNNTIHAINDGGTVNYLINSSLDPSNISVEGDAVVFFGWYVTVNNTFNDGTALQGAVDSSYFNTTQTFETSKTSDGLGIAILESSELKVNSSGITYLTPHNVSMTFAANSTNATNATSFNLTVTQSRQVNLSTSLNCVAPDGGSDLNLTTSTTLCPGTYDFGRKDIDFGAPHVVLTCTGGTTIKFGREGGIGPRGNNNITIQHCNFIKTSTDVWSVLGVYAVNDTKIINNTFLQENNPKTATGIRVTGVQEGLNISGNTIEGFNRGIWIDEVNSSVFHNNTFISNTISFDSYYNKLNNLTLYHNNFTLTDIAFSIGGTDINFNISVNISNITSAQGNAYSDYCDQGLDHNGDGYADNDSSASVDDWPLNVSANFADYGPLIQDCVQDVQLGSGNTGGGGGSSTDGGGGGAAPAAPAGPGSTPPTPDEPESLDDVYSGAEEVLRNVDFTELEDGFSLYNKGNKTLLLDNVIEGDEEDVQTIFQSKAIVDNEDSFGTGWLLQGDISEENLVKFVDEAKKRVKLEPGETTEITANNVISSQNRKLSLVIKEATSQEDVKRIEKDIKAELTLAVDQPRNGFIDIYYAIPSNLLTGKHYFEINVYRDDEVQKEKTSMRSFIGKLFTGNLWGTKLLYTETHGPRHLDSGFTVGKQYWYNCLYDGKHRINLKILNEVGQEVESKGFNVNLQCER